MKPGHLLQSKMDGHGLFFPIINGNIIDNNPFPKVPCRVSQGDVLMFVDFLDLTYDTTTQLPILPFRYPGNLREKFRLTGKISGGIFLTGDGKKIWISEFDQKNME